MDSSRRRRLRTWSLGLLPLLALAAVLAGIAVHGRAGGVTSRASDRPGTVLLVAGYGGSTSALSVLATRLRAVGRTVTIVPPVGDNTGDLRVQARQLQKQALAASSGGTASVDVVGYSAGGVVTRIWAADLGGGALARRIVTLGSPHHGTDVAGLAAGLLSGSCPLACRQLAPDSDVLEGLPEAPAGPAWTSIWTSDDDLVLPPSSAVLRGAVDIELQQLCPASRVDHSGLPRDPFTESLVVRALDGPALTAAPAAGEISC
jgi:triacylglycerol esterase/lipase EstA (alpha/beta hydrolase family)